MRLCSDMKERQDDAPGVDHVNAMLERDPDDVVLGEISSDGCQPVSDAISFVRLREMRSL